jgi:hypothetical protein
LWWLAGCGGGKIPPFGALLFPPDFPFHFAFYLSFFLSIIWFLTDIWVTFVVHCTLILT